MSGTGTYKVPGEDGYHALFFQQCWDIVTNFLFHYVNLASLDKPFSYFCY